MNDGLDNIKLLLEFCQVYRNLVDTFTAPSELPRAQGHVLLRLLSKDGLTQSELGEQLCVQGATVTNMLQRLEESGCIIRRRDAEDNRLVRVYLTDVGRQKGQIIAEQYERLDSLLFSTMSDDERAVMEKLVSRLMDQMREIAP